MDSSKYLESMSYYFLICDGHCYGLHVYIPPPPNSSVETLTPNVLVLGGGTFRRWLGREGGTLMNGSGDLKRDPRELSCSSTM